MDSSVPPNPKTARVPVVPLEQIVAQELAIKRAKIAAEKAEPMRPGQRWLLLILALLLLLGGTIWAFLQSRQKIQHLNDLNKTANPPAAPARR